MNVYEEIKKCGIIPVVAMDKCADIVPLANALIKGGLRCIEITFRTDAAQDAISMLRQNIPDMIIAAGTVLTTEQVDQAIEAGADFIVSPGSNTDVIKHCLSRNIDIIPGVMTPSEIERNLQLGIDVMKFFPAEQVGGIDFLKALHGPYRTVRFMPTGGLNAANVGSYLEQDYIIACGGSWMVKPSMINDNEWDQIAQLAHEASQIVAELR